MGTLFGIQLLTLFALTAGAADSDFEKPHFPIHKPVQSPQRCKPGSCTHALILLGASRSPANNDTFLWNDVSFFYSTLQNKGVSKQNIEVLIPPETTKLNKADSIMDPQPVFVPLPQDLDGDNKSDSNGAPSRDALKNSIQKIKSRLNPGDKVIVFIAAHGVNGRNPGFELSPQANPPVLSHKEMDKILDEIPSSNPTAVILGSCYGGSFTEYKSPNRCTLTASGPNETATAKGTHETFANYFTAALAGRTSGGQPLNEIPEIWKPARPMNFASAFQFANLIMRTTQKDHPQISSAGETNASIAAAEKLNKLNERLCPKRACQPGQYLPDPENPEGNWKNAGSRRHLRPTLAAQQGPRDNEICRKFTLP